MELFKRLLDKSTRYKIRLLFILKNQNDFISLKELSKKSGLEQRTTERYITEIFDDFSNFRFSDSNLTITISHAKKIKLQYELYEDFYSFQLFIISQSFSVILLSDLLLGNEIITSQYINKHFISASTMRRRIEKILPILKTYNIKLNKNREGIILVGEELQIRILAYTFFWTLYKGKTWPFSIDRQLIENIECGLFKNFENQLSKTNIEDSSYILAINILRFRKGYPIEYSDEWLYDFMFEDYILYKNNWTQQYHLSENEYYFYLLVLQTQAKFYLDDRLKLPLIKFHQESNTPLNVSVQAFFDSFSKEIHSVTSSQKNDYYVYIFANHLFCALFNNAPTGMLGQSVITDIDNKFPILKSKLEVLIEQLSIKVKSTIFNNKDFLLPNYVLFFSFLQNISYFETQISIYIDTDLPVLAEQRLKTQLLNYFGDNFNIKILTTVKTLKNSNFDLILTNSFLPEIKSAIKSNQLIYISEELDLDDITRIKNVLENIRKEKKS